MPNPEDLLSQVAETRFFCKLDLTKGYYQITMEENSKQFAAFTTSEGLYQFRILPFGLSNSPSTFVRFMRRIFGHHKNVLHY